MEPGDDVIRKLRALGEHLADPELTAQIFEEMPDALVVIDQAGSIQLVNRQTELLFVYHRKELFDQPVETLLPEAVREAHVRHREGFCREPRVRPMGMGLDLQGRRKDGSLFPVEISLSPIVTVHRLYVMAAIRPKR